MNPSLPKTLRFHSFNLFPSARKPPPGTTKKKFLTFLMETQKESQWCWAAVAKSINDFYLPTVGSSTAWTQCLIAEHQLGKMCCPIGCSAACNVSSKLSPALTLVGRLHNKSKGKPLFSSVSSEIDSDKVVGVAILWAKGGGHFASIGGYDATRIVIKDPWYGQTTLDFASFPVSYQGSGTWDTSYWTQP